MIGARARRAPIIVLLACITATACGGDEGRVVVHVEMHGLDPSALSLSEAPTAIHRAAGGVDVALDASSLASSLVIEHPEACSARVSLRGARRGDRLTADLRPVIDLGPGLPQLGFDRPFAIEVRPGCDEAREGTIEWRVISGGDVRELAVDDRGFVVRGRTAETLAADVPWGVVPLSPRTRGEHVLEATHRRAGREVRRTVRIAAAGRATGVPTVGLTQRVYLGGDGWRVVETPPGSRAAIEPSSGLASLVPDVPGRFTLADAADRTLVVSANRHDGLPLDCGRSECHASAADHAARSPMTRVLGRGLDGSFPDYDPSCAIACHAVGEPGLDDGGLAHVARDMEHALPHAGRLGAWADLPRALRRLGGVGCTACHGPAAIPDRSAWWTILRSDVCAVCHDAPPRYGHVVALASSRMARAGAAAGARGDPACARCHETAGFLGAIGVREAARSTAPDHVAPIGIACAACHAPHGDDVGRALVRRVAVPPLLRGAIEPDTISGICLPCHSPDPAGARPAASAGALWLGRGGVAVVTGAPLAAQGVHATVPDGCIGCHSGPRSDTPDVERGGGHAFAVDREQCTACHDGEPRERGPAVRDRALALAARLGIALGDRPPHASPADEAHDDPRLARAIRNVRLVLEDPAAAPHGAPYARRLLDEAENALTTPDDPVMLP